MPVPRPGLERLTPRQRQVALLMLEGYTVKQIARLLEISFSGVCKRTFYIYEKFGVHNPQQFVCHYFNTVWRRYHEKKLNSGRNRKRSGVLNARRKFVA
jgi:DNA-binding NarL/FixJ family response regulator